MKRQTYLADKLADAIRDHAGAPRGGPIDVAAVAEQIPGVLVVPSTMRADGQLIPHEGLWTIRVNADQPRERQRFTIAHELAHLALRDPGIGGQAARNAAAGFSSHERLCDMTAAALLMPHWWTRDWYTQRSPDARMADAGLVAAFAGASGASYPAAFVRLQATFSWQAQLSAWVRDDRARWLPSTEVGHFRSNGAAVEFPAEVVHTLARIHVQMHPPPSQRYVVGWSELPVADAAHGERWQRVQLAVSTRTINAIFADR